MSKKLEEIKEHACVFVLHSDVMEAFPGGVEHLMDLCAFDDTPFTWGDANQTLIDSATYADFMEGSLEKKTPEVIEWLNGLRKLPYIDMEN